MKHAELRKKTKDELQKIMIEGRAKLQQLRFDLPSGKIKNVREIRQLRRQTARILTLLKQKEQ